METSYRCLLVGNANAGKTSVFNRLTGLSQKTGNFPGVTVGIATGTISSNDRELELIDLPGSFSLNANSEDKKTLTRFLMSRKPTDKIVFVLDAMLLERSLQFLFQIMDLGAPLLLVITMKDILEKKNISIDLDKLKNELGIEVILVNGKTGDKIPELKELLLKESSFKTPERLWAWDEKRETFFKNLLTRIEADNKHYLSFVLSNALKKLSGEKLQKELPGIEEFNPTIQNFIQMELVASGLLFKYQEEVIYKSFKIKSIISHVLNGNIENQKSKSAALDKIVLHPFFGMITFFAIMALVFQSLFSWSELPMEWIEKTFDTLANYFEKSLPIGPLNGLLTKGIIGGVGSVLVFIPQISLLFLFIGIMEESGYLSRVSFIMDKFMGKFGLSGKSFIPLLSSAACAVPAIMSTRTIENKSDKMTTILISPLITCSARYPVYILVIGAIFPKENVFGIFSLQALILFGLFILGMGTALLFALLFKKTFFKHESSYFLIELPSYKIPSVKNLSLSVYQNVKAFIVNSGTIILYVSIVLWFLAYYPVNVGSEGAETKSEISESYAARLGKTIEPVLQPLGFDWKIGVGIISSFAAREVLVSTLAIIYGVEGDETSDDLKTSLQSDINPKTGKKTWSILTAISLLIFFAYASQCMSTLAVVRQETKSFFWPAFLFVYMTILAYFSSLAVYQIGTALGFGN
ncbi:MAG TPA: ferrous iron transport protein B [Leptospiraceae bacterium]|nr:ferrous iron transport protein B [Leptospiraceae bacterium]HMW07851.1 ferrous iron transport protein B [Leptospiraceae bacterium]HMX32337.1 ferrous iron transport protein B [Leptospiraceae bacterium]HMY32656.1 ferrous iron transport protein B [Leptospiraceae bacterium]HMZ66921.1 ferrous iron transport protein B [Leptospiraceae bacterium]